jgi:hypothetical protein
MRRELDGMRELLRRYPGEWCFVMRTAQKSKSSNFQRNLRMTGDPDFLVSQRRDGEILKIYAKWEPARTR